MLQKNLFPLILWIIYVCIQDWSLIKPGNNFLYLGEIGRKGEKSVVMNHARYLQSKGRSLIFCSLDQNRFFPDSHALPMGQCDFCDSVITRKKGKYEAKKKRNWISKRKKRLLPIRNDTGVGFFLRYNRENANCGSAIEGRNNMEKA